MPIPRAVLFDAGNTLVFIDRDRILEIFRKMGLDPDEARFGEAEREARFELSTNEKEGLSGTERQVWMDYFATLFRRSGVPEEVTGAVAERLREVHATDHLWSHVDPRTPEALETLLDRGHRLAVVSNADGRVEALLEDRGLTPYLEFVIDSHVVGVAKPDPGIFRIALDRLGLPAEDVLYVGDLYAVDVKGARAAGLEAVLLDPWDRLGRWDDVDRIPAVADLPEYLAGR